MALYPDFGLVKLEAEVKSKCANLSQYTAAQRSEFYETLGIAQFFGGHYVQCLSSFDAALRLKCLGSYCTMPTPPPAHASPAVQAAAARELAQFLPPYERSYARMSTLSGIACFRKGDFHQAEAFFEKVLCQPKARRHDPDYYCVAASNAAIVQLQLDKSDNARHFASEAVKICSNFKKWPLTGRDPNAVLPNVHGAAASARGDGDVHTPPKESAAAASATASKKPPKGPKGGKKGAHGHAQGSKDAKAQQAALEAAEAAEKKIVPQTKNLKLSDHVRILVLIYMRTDMTEVALNVLREHKNCFAAREFQLLEVGCYVAQGEFTKSLHLLTTAVDTNLAGGARTMLGSRSDSPQRHFSAAVASAPARTSTPPLGRVAGGVANDGTGAGAGAGTSGDKNNANADTPEVNTHWDEFAFGSEKVDFMAHKAEYDQSCADTVHDAMIHYNISILREYQRSQIPEEQTTSAQSTTSSNGEEEGGEKPDEAAMREVHHEISSTEHFKQAIKLLTTALGGLQEEREYYANAVGSSSSLALFACSDPDSQLTALVAMSYMALSSVEMNLTNVMFIDGLQTQFGSTMKTLLSSLQLQAEVPQHTTAGSRKQHRQGHKSHDAGHVLGHTARGRRKDAAASSLDPFHKHGKPTLATLLATPAPADLNRSASPNLMEESSRHERHYGDAESATFATERHILPIVNYLVTDHHIGGGEGGLADVALGGESAANSSAGTPREGGSPSAPVAPPVAEAAAVAAVEAVGEEADNTEAAKTVEGDDGSSMNVDRFKMMQKSKSGVKPQRSKSMNENDADEAQMLQRLQKTLSRKFEIEADNESSPAVKVPAESITSKSYIQTKLFPLIRHFQEGENKIDHVNSLFMHERHHLDVVKSILALLDYSYLVLHDMILVATGGAGSIDEVTHTGRHKKSRKHGSASVDSIGSAEGMSARRDDSPFSLSVSGEIGMSGSFDQGDFGANVSAVAAKKRVLTRLYKPVTGEAHPQLSFFDTVIAESAIEEYRVLISLLMGDYEDSTQHVVVMLKKKYGHTVPSRMGDKKKLSIQFNEKVKNPGQQAALALLAGPEAVAKRKKDKEHKEKEHVIDEEEEGGSVASGKDSASAAASAVKKVDVEPVVTKGGPIVVAASNYHEIYERASVRGELFPLGTLVENKKMDKDELILKNRDASELPKPRVTKRLTSDEYSYWLQWALLITDVPGYGFMTFSCHQYINNLSTLNPDATKDVYNALKRVYDDLSAEVSQSRTLMGLFTEYERLRDEKEHMARVSMALHAHGHGDKDHHSQGDYIYNEEDDHRTILSKIKRAMASHAVSGSHTPMDGSHIPLLPSNHALALKLLFCAALIKLGVYVSANNEISRYLQEFREHATLSQDATFLAISYRFSLDYEEYDFGKRALSQAAKDAATKSMMPTGAAPAAPPPVNYKRTTQELQKALKMTKMYENFAFLTKDMHLRKDALKRLINVYMECSFCKKAADAEKATLANAPGANMAAQAASNKHGGAKAKPPSNKPEDILAELQDMTAESIDNKEAVDGTWLLRVAHVRAQQTMSRLKDLTAVLTVSA